MKVAVRCRSRRLTGGVTGQTRSLERKDAEDDIPDNRCRRHAGCWRARARRETRRGRRFSPACPWQEAWPPRQVAQAWPQGETLSRPAFRVLLAASALFHQVPHPACELLVAPQTPLGHPRGHAADPDLPLGFRLWLPGSGYRQVPLPGSKEPPPLPPGRRFRVA